MNRTEKIIANRTAARKEALTLAWKKIHKDLQEAKISHQFFGSFTKGEVRSKSDLDLMIFGRLNLEQRNLVGRIALVASHEADVDCDLVFEMDLSQESMEAIFGD